MHRASLAIVALASCIAVSIASADDAPPTSPRMTALAAKVKAKERGAEDAFWKQVASEGTPLVEDVHLPGRLLVTFLWHGNRDTGRVVLFGPVDFTNPESAELTRIPGSNVFALSTVLPDTARFQYAFDPHYVRAPGGKRDRPPVFRDDPLNRRRRRTESLCDLPNAPPQPSLVPHRETQPGVVWDHEVTSAALGNHRAISVYTPAGFATTGARYPLLVAFDREAALGALALPIVLDELIAANKIPPVVAVLIGNVDRVKDLGASSAFADFVALDLVPWIRGHYHATADPRLTVISGISLGGLASANAALRHPEVLGNVLSQSGSFWWPRGDDGSEPESTARAYVAAPHLPIRFWMEIGTLEFGGIHIAANRHMRDVLTAKGYDLTFREFAGVHDYMSWRGTIADGITALLGSPPRPPAPAPPSSGKPGGNGGNGGPGGIEVTAAKRSILSHLERIALLDGGDAAVAAGKRLLETGPGDYVMDENTMNTTAYALLGIEHTGEALPLFEWNAQRFPQSANVLDSLGEAQYTAGDRVKALATFKRAVQLDPKGPTGAESAAMVKRISEL